MPIRDLQITLAEVGRIRLGLSPQAAGSKNPAKLEHFRFTSPAEHLIRGIAELYGGTAQPWQPQNGGSRQWEVLSEANSVPVYVPRQTIDPWYEQWGNGVCTRRCDGVHDTIHDKACTCDPENRACKPTVRVSVILADLVGTGTWRLESHGFYAATELTALSPMLEATRMPIPGILLLDQRERKYFDRQEGKPKVKKYPVPMVMFDSVIARTLMGGAEALHQALTGQAEQRGAIESGGTDERAAQQVLADRVNAATSRDEMMTLQREIVDAGRPVWLTNLWSDKARALAGQEKAAHPAQTAQPTGDTDAEQRLAAIDQMLARIEVAESREQMQGIKTDIAQSGIGNPTLTKAWNARAAALVNAQNAAAGKPAAAGPDNRPQQPTAADTVEGEVEPDSEEVFMAVLNAAGKAGLDSGKLEEIAEAEFGKPVMDLDGFQMQQLLEKVKKQP